MPLGPATRRPTLARAVKTRGLVVRQPSAFAIQSGGEDETILQTLMLGRIVPATPAERIGEKASEH